LLSPSSTCPTSKCLSIERAILTAIDQGQYQPGKRLPGETALAKFFGVAPLTVRRAMQRLCDSGILERKHRSGTFVCGTTACPNVAILMFHLRHAGPAAVLDPIVTRIHAHQPQAPRQVQGLVLFEPLPPVADTIAQLRLQRVGAVGLLGFLNTDRTFVQTLAQAFPCVLFNKSLPGVSLPCAMPDAAAMARMAVDHFAAHGCRRIGAAAFCGEHQLHSEFLLAVEFELNRRGLAVDRRFWFAPSAYPTEEETRAWIDRLSRESERPDAMLCSVVPVATQVRERFAVQGTRGSRPVEIVSLSAGSGERGNQWSWPLLSYNDLLSTETAAGMLLDILDGRLAPGAAPVLRTRPLWVAPGATEPDRRLTEV